MGSISRSLRSGRAFFAAMTETAEVPTGWRLNIEGWLCRREEMVALFNRAAAIQKELVR
jgi:hypothetical protein